MPTLAIVVLIAAALAAVAFAALRFRRSPATVASHPPPRVRILAEHVVNKVSTHDADGTFRYVSPVLAELLGQDAGSLVGRHPREFAHPDDVAVLNGLWKRAVGGRGAASTVAWRCRRHTGEYAWLESTARVSAEEVAELGDIVCASRDITERKQIEDALRESEQRFRSTVETVRLVAVGLDPTGRVTFCNDALCALTGWTRAELTGEQWFDVAVPTNDPARRVFFENIQKGTLPAKIEHEILCKDGRRRTIDWDTTLLRAPDGSVSGVASLGADVTDRRQEETAIKLLQTITMSISASNDLDAALALALESLCTATGWGYAEAWLPESDGMHLTRTTHVAALGVDAGPLVRAGESAAFAPGEGLPGRAWESRSVVWVPDIHTAEQSLADTAIACGFRAAVALPVMAEQQVVAIFVFFMDRPRATDVRHTQMVQVVANQVGALIERRLEQQRYEGELLRARDAAEAASHAKSDFLSRMSHELRTPLNSVIGFANVLRKNKSGGLSPDDVAFLERITKNGQHLLALVNDILDIAKVEAGRLTVTTGLVAVDQLLHDVVAQLEGQPRAEGVALRAEAPEDLAPIESDHVLLKQVLINLAGNAIRFTHEGSVVLSVEADDQGRPLRITVRDTGIGISPDRQGAIFEPFEQADATTHKEYGGTGLGLSISRAICEALGYRLTCESALGKGSTFTVHVSDSDRSVPKPDTVRALEIRGRRAQTQQR